MDRRMTQGEQNLLLLQSIIPRTEKLYVWCYGENGARIASSCPEREEALLDRGFQILGGWIRPWLTPALADGPDRRSSAPLSECSGPSPLRPNSSRARSS